MTDDEIRRICGDYCDALDACDRENAACPVDCAESFREASDDDVRNCKDDLYAFEGEHSFFGSVERAECVATDGSGREITCTWTFNNSGGAINGAFCDSPEGGSVSCDAGC
ncbi:MAG: hypothetical protein HYY06_10165 [Deltaproteobacteria bacterium]|nr:hypothetical protein [Deltaproteobacteria bacterium]